ncbi:hypothetical protein [Burkholderia gladioli]|uniref:hypothetical protein n=1 Tax=Burkholderia gladioli TaxID=28095 RepID=UPI00187D6C76|nr:hypothetical protein [Burkholderia gladioli]
MTSVQIIEALHGAHFHWSTPEARRTRVSIHLLCKNGWLKQRCRDGVMHYRYAKARPPRPNQAIHGQKPRPPVGMTRLTGFLPSWVAAAVAADISEEKRYIETS